MRKTHGRDGFTLLDLMMVTLILAVLIGCLVAGINRARRAVNAVKEGALIRQKIDDAILRRAIKKQPQATHYTDWLREQIRQGSK